VYRYLKPTYIQCDRRWLNNIGARTNDKNLLNMAKNGDFQPIYYSCNLVILTYFGILWVYKNGTPWEIKSHSGFWVSI